MDNDKIESYQNALQFIIDLGFDYDGYESADNLKSLIDDMVRFAELGLKGEMTWEKIAKEATKPAPAIDEFLENPYNTEENVLWDEYFNTHFNNDSEE